ncbi:hypothetical protein Hanom_Chr14g01314131 [Helianthus anomalus]
MNDVFESERRIQNTEGMNGTNDMFESARRIENIEEIKSMNDMFESARRIQNIERNENRMKRLNSYVSTDQTSKNE